MEIIINRINAESSCEQTRNHCLRFLEKKKDSPRFSEIVMELAHNMEVEISDILQLAELRESQAFLSN